jgi:hypothetical protein
MLQLLDLVDKVSMRRYLLEKTQHIVGGFGKGIGEPPGKAYTSCPIQSLPPDHNRHHALLPWSGRTGNHRRRRSRTLRSNVLHQLEGQTELAASRLVELNHVGSFKITL